MPVMGGLEAARAMRELGYKGPIIGLTGNALDEDVVVMMKAGCNKVLSKPTTASQLTKVCDEFFFSSRPRQRRRRSRHPSSTSELSTTSLEIQEAAAASVEESSQTDDFQEEMTH